MSPELEALLHKAHRSLAASQRLFEDADWYFAASRAYYAMSYLAEALPGTVLISLLPGKS